MSFPIIDLIIEGTITLQGSDITTLLNNLSSSVNDYDNHIASTLNPHNVTKTQVGLGNVDNTSDLDKPVSTATKNAINPLYQTTLIELNGVIEINSLDPTKFDFPSGKGLIYKNGEPIEVTWTEFLSQSTPFLTTSTNTFIAIDENSSLVLTQDLQSVVNMGSVIPIGFLEHVGNTEIEVAKVEPQYNINLGTQWQQFLETFGSFIVEGFDVSVSLTNVLGLSVGAGTIFDNGLGYAQNINAPNHFSQIAIDDVEIKYYYRDGVGGWVNASSSVLNVVPDKYDDGSGTLQNIPVGKFSVQRVTYYPPFGNLDIYYGQKYYDSIEDALIGYTVDTFEDNPYLSYNSDVAILIINQGTTDLNNTTDTLIRKSRGNGVGGSSQGGGEINTASNVGNLGVGVFDTKVGVDLQFKNIAPNSNKVSVTSGIDKNIKIDVVESNFTNIPQSSVTNLTTDITNSRSRDNHTGTQTASTISDFTATVRNTVLTGLGAFTNVAISAADSILSAMSKLQGQINDKANISGQVFTGNISATNLSNTNTGDETTASIQAKRPLKTINGNSLEGVGNIIIAGGGGSTVSFFTKRLVNSQSTTANVPISLVGQSFEIPPGHCLTIWGTLIFTSAATNTGASYGLNVLQETGADANAVGSFLTHINLSSAPAATGLSDGDVINVAQNSNTNYMTLGTASSAGNNSAFICATIYNLSTNGTTFITMAFHSETNGTAVTAQANSSVTGILGLIQ